MTRRSDVDALRARIREAATRLFARTGFHGTTVQQIADEVGISKQLVLYHYSSKATLRRAVLDEVASAWNRLLPRIMDGVSRPGARLEDVLDDIIEFLDGHADLGRVVMLELIQGSDIAAAEGLDESVRPWLRLAADVIRHRQADGQFAPDADPEACVVQISTMLLATTALLHLHGDAWPEDVEAGAWRRRRLLEGLRMIRASLQIEQIEPIEGASD